MSGTTSKHLHDKLVLKGGILIGLVYDSPRLTADIDLSTDFTAEPGIHETIKDLLDGAFATAASKLGYADMIVKVHSVRTMPKKIGIQEADFPAIKLKIAFAKRGTAQEKALEEGKTPGVLDVDISFNEPLSQIQTLELTGGEELRAYGLVDLIAEKYRAMLQQVIRKRNRRQDVYDLDRLIADKEPGNELQGAILEAFRIKCQWRNIEPTQESLRDPLVKDHSKAEWETMEIEIGDIPDFEDCFERVATFYEKLPW